jgi:hypothetical protein
MGDPERAETPFIYGILNDPLIVTMTVLQSSKVRCAGFEGTHTLFPYKTPSQSRRAGMGFSGAAIKMHPPATNHIFT